MYIFPLYKEMSKPTEIFPGLFVGDIYTAQSASFFNKHGITAVVNCTESIPLYFESQGINYFRVPVNDTPFPKDNEVMAKFLPSAIKFIDKSLAEHGKVLIHCHAGVSRSATVTAAYLRHCCCDNVHQAIGLVLARRPIAFFSGRYINFLPALHTVFKDAVN